MQREIQKKNELEHKIQQKTESVQKLQLVKIEQIQIKKQIDNQKRQFKKERIELEKEEFYKKQLEMQTIYDHDLQRFNARKQEKLLV